MLAGSPRSRPSSRWRTWNIKISVIWNVAQKSFSLVLSSKYSSTFEGRVCFYFALFAFFIEKNAYHKK